MDLITIEELAKKLKISTETVRKFIKNGSLGYLRIGHKFFFDCKHIEDFLKRSEHRARTLED